MYYREEMSAMTVTLRLSDADMRMIRDYAKLKGQTVSEVMRRAMLEKIEDEIDLDCYNRALSEWKKNPITYTQDEVERMLGIE